MASLVAWLALLGLRQLSPRTGLGDVSQIGDAVVEPLKMFEERRSTVSRLQVDMLGVVVVGRGGVERWFGVLLWSAGKAEMKRSDE